MIVTRLSAGLGNQLFQYAAAHELGLRLGADVRCDAYTWFARRDHRRSTRRDYLLPRLGLNPIEASAAERAAPFQRNVWLQRRPRAGWTHLQQVGGKVPLDAFQRATAPAFLEGYWQGEAFFPIFKPVLARQLLALSPASESNARWLAAVRAPGAIALHVRRGDYIANDDRSPGYRVLTSRYYQDALVRLGAAGAARSAVVFSDDPAWCEAHLPLSLPTLVVQRNDPGKCTIDDFLCLAQAANLVIANSTFSWWAAWIATQRGGTRVVAPAQWFEDPEFAEWSRHLQVPGWIAL